LESTELRHGFVDLDEARLHFVEAGAGPLVVLLHGFPGFWYSWRHQIAPLASAGFHVIAPDMRGYNLSSRPEAVADYDIDRLANDVRDLLASQEVADAFLAGHDWGGAVAWWTAMGHPGTVRRLAVLNCPHPRRLQEGLLTPRQLARSWYLFAFQMPWLPERLLRASDWWPFRYALEHDASPGTFTTGDIASYVEAWEQPGAMTAALNYYRALARVSAADWLARIKPVDAPTLVVWADQDRYLGPELAEPHSHDVHDVRRVVHLPQASHWVQEEEPELVSQLLTEFFSEADDGHSRPVPAGDG